MLVLSPNRSNPENPCKTLEHSVYFEQDTSAKVYIFDCFPPPKRKLEWLTLQLVLTKILHVWRPVRLPTFRVELPGDQGRAQLTTWFVAPINYRYILVGGFSHLETYEFVNGKGYPIYYGK